MRGSRRPGTNRVAKWSRSGLLNPALYRLQGDGGIVDITVGDNSFVGATGYNAGTSYDLASGLGTVDASKLVHKLAH